MIRSSQMKTTRSNQQEHYNSQSSIDQRKSKLLRVIFALMKMMIHDQKKDIHLILSLDLLINL